VLVLIVVNARIEANSYEIVPGEAPLQAALHQEPRKFSGLIHTNVLGRRGDRPVEFLKQPRKSLDNVDML
jgi:hypothetical protein